jgi:tRNA-Thr(GGU) m(6)t(6)A37 methyltransferase TsaA
LWNFTTIGWVRSPFPDKFGVPRQAGLHTLSSVIELATPFDAADCVRGLEGFSHLWVSFIFHLTAAQGWQPLVRPPRLGGNRKVGVFASRSPFRPNPLGLSVVKLEGIQRDNGKTLLLIRGGDFVDGTPVVDIKPYIAFADAVESAVSGYASEPPGARLQVTFAAEARAYLDSFSRHCHSPESIIRPGATARPDSTIRPGPSLNLCGDSNLETMIVQTLTLDPRPAYAKPGQKTYYLRLFDLEIAWEAGSEGVTVSSIKTYVETVDP